MIKRFNKFVKDRVDEAITMADPKPETAPTPAPTTTPDAPPAPTPRPTRPGIMPDRTPSEKDAPMAMREEEEGDYKGQIIMRDLANELGAEVEEDGSILYNGKKINFYSETEKIHIDKKKFDTIEDAVNYLNRESDMVQKKPEVEPEYAYESKSYKAKRLKRK